MTKRHPTNERMKLQYFDLLKHSGGKADKTVRQVEKAILRFEEFTKFADFKRFDQKQAIGFKAALSGTELAPATVLLTVNKLQAFLSWLAMQPGYKRRIKPSDIEYLNLSEKFTRAAMAPAEKAFPTMEMVEKTIAAMPYRTATEKRNRAVIAFTAVTGIRDGAMISLKLKHFNADRRLVLQDPREVTTKFSKRIDTFLFPLNDDFEQIVLGWISYLRAHALFGENDPLFPKTAVGHDENDCFTPTGLSREHWATGSPVRAIFRDAFNAIGLPAFTPHRFRDMIVSEAYRRKLPVDEMKAWSQNLGHEGLLTTLTSYGQIPLEQQGQLVRKTEVEPNDRPLTKSEFDRLLEERGL